MSAQKYDYVPHPWHGLSVGENPPDIIDSFIEIIPTDTVKYEIDKVSGYIRLDRPQKYSSHSPSLYGFIPQTYCGGGIAKFCMEKTGRQNIVGDGDPLDVCVISSSAISHGSIIVPSVPIGGFRMIDRGEADDKIIAIMKGDPVYGAFKDVTELPKGLVNTLKHYFLTYKVMPHEDDAVVEIAATYGAAEAKEIILISMIDYRNKFEQK
jgi:inorganic pyrophosphatase